MLEKIALGLYVGHLDAVILPGEPIVAGHGFAHGFRRSPADAARLVIQVPDHAAHDHAGGFDVFVRQSGDNVSHGGDGMPLDHGVRVV